MPGLCVYPDAARNFLGASLPSEEIEQFIAISRKYLAGAYVKIALEPLTPSELSTMWSLIRGVEAAMKLRGISLQDELEQLDRDLEDLFRPSKRTHEIREPTEFLL
jgi:hypothetical protein